MPRPKVKPQDRQRSEQACQPCKAAKVRCNGQTPCLRCSKRGRINACVFDPMTRKSTSQPGPAMPSPASSMRDIADIYTESRLLYSSKGEKVFVGETASLSFLQFLRVVVRQHLGSCDFTDADFRDCMLEIDASQDSEGVIGEQSIDEQQALISVFMQVSSGLLDLYPPDELLGMVGASSIDKSGLHASTKSSRDSHAIFHAVLAIGAQARGDPIVDVPYARHYFKLAQSHAFAGMLCDPSLSMVRLFLLMAFYLMGACHRNAAFIYLGVAAKAACALGLHKEEQSRELALEERDARSRCWTSLRVLDGVANCILGRPNCLPVPYAASGEPTSPGSQDTSQLACRGILELLSLVDGLDLKSRRGAVAEADEAIRLLEQTRAWSQNLPSHLQPGRPQLDNGSIAQLHVSCAYYFTIILITRPFMVSHTTKKLRNSTSAVTEHLPAAPSDQNVSDLAQVCLDSSLYLSHAAHTAMTSGVLMANMCILKAWVFAAGLIIGFSLFGHQEASSEGLEHARAVLAYLRASSPQAALYHDILTSLADAVTTQRERVMAQRRSLTDRYVQPFLGEAVTVEPFSAFNTPPSLPSSTGGEMAPMGMSLLWDDIDFDWASLDFTFPV